MTPQAVCVFCGNVTGKPYQIDPFGRACPSCTDSFFTSKKRYPPTTKFSEEDLARVLAAQLGPPYKGRPLKINVTDTGAGPYETVGYGLPDRLGGRGLYVYRGPFRKRVFLQAQAAGDVARKRLNWHTAEYQKVIPRVAWIVWQETDGGRGKEAEVKGYWAISTQRARELSRQYQTPNGVRIGPPLEACAHYDPTFHLKTEATDLSVLADLAKLPAYAGEAS